MASEITPSVLLLANIFTVKLQTSIFVHKKLEMWANAQRDGRPVEYRWCPLFNATVWLTPTTRCRAVTLPRRETS